MSLPSIAEKLVLAVAQQPFDTENRIDGLRNRFCSLLPVLREDSSPADRSDFPDNGQVWWMLTGTAHLYAEPGRLVSARLEPARDPAPGRSHYQVDIKTVEPVRSNDLVEIIDVPGSAITSPRDLITKDDLARTDHPPVDVVWVRNKGLLYGPLRVTSTPRVGHEFSLRFETSQADHTVFVVAVDHLKSLGDAYIPRVEVEVSTDSQNVDRSLSRVACRYDLLLGSSQAQLIAKAKERLHLEPHTKIIQRVAKQVLNRKRRQELQSLIEELKTTVEGTSSYKLSEDEARVLEVVRGNAQTEEQALDQIAQAVVQSGRTAKRVEAAIDAEVRRHIESKATTLQAEITTRVAKTESTLKELEEKKASIEGELDSLRRSRLAATEREISQHKEAFERECDEQRRAIREQRVELDRQRETLSRHLEEVTRRLADKSDEVVNQFLAIAPLLPHIGRPAAVVATNAHATQPTSDAAPRDRGARDALGLPAYVTNERALAQPLDEDDFFARFETHVTGSGFQHRRRDLVAFHLSVKCGELTILGGPPGTGKSTLPGLYYEAVAGGEAGERRDGLLNISVSPAWLDMRDLLGHVNALDRVFLPSETGLYQKLIHAAEEHRRFGADSGLHLVCLDEMNLAQVEHYFSAFLIALDQQSPEMRQIRCFSPQSLAPESPFADWSTVQLPFTLRFVGTVNEDETTKPLSQRLLDRSNLVRLRPGDTTPSTDGERPTPTGTCVTLSHFRQWTREAPFERRAAELLDEVRPHLALLGCPLNPRRVRAVQRFVASAPPALCTQDEAMDLQIAQRLIPQIRGLFRREARAAFEKLCSLLNARGTAFEESLRSLEELRELDFEGAAAGE